MFTIADADIESLKSLMYLDHMLVEFEQNRIVGTVQNFVPSYIKWRVKWLTIFDKLLTPFCKTFLWLKQLFDETISIQRLSSFSVPKLRVTSGVARAFPGGRLAHPESRNEEEN